MLSASKRIFWRVSSLTKGLPLRARDTVVCDTCASCAMSLMVTLPMFTLLLHACANDPKKRAHAKKYLCKSKMLTCAIATSIVPYYCRIVQCPYCTKIKFFFQHIENKNSFALRKAPFHGIITMIMRPLRRLLEELYVNSDRRQSSVSGQHPV